VELQVQRKELVTAICRFLEELPETERRIFLLRYWYLHPIGEIAEKFGWTTSKVTSMLHRLREKLRKQLAKEGLL
jgi:RNA polymerase sigma-70 factor (ECF subfamily)